MTLSSAIAATRAKIRKFGWAVHGVSDLGCDCGDHGPAPLARSGRDPYLYTSGLTDAGLPELLLQLPGKNSMEWIEAGHRLINAVAAHTLHEELTVGQVLPTHLRSVSVTVKEPDPFSREDGRVWPGMAYELYGQEQVRVLEIVASW